MSEYLTMKQIAQELGVRVETVRRWVRSGQLPGILLGRAGYRIHQEDFARFVQRKQQHLASAPLASISAHQSHEAPVTMEATATAILESFYDSVPFMMGVAELDGDKTVALSANQKLSDFLGRSTENLRGHTGMELGNSQRIERMWVEQFRRCQRENGTITFEYQEPRLPATSWLKGTVSCIGIGPTGRPRFSFVVEDITERKRGEERQQFLLKLSDVLRPLTHAVDIQKTAMKLLAKHLDVIRASFYEIDADQDGARLVAGYETVPLAMPPKFRISDFGPDLTVAYLAGRTVVVSDSEIDPPESQRAACRAMGVRAWIGVPLVKDGVLLTVLGIHSPIPRRWMTDEVQLLEEIAERLWSTTQRAIAEEALRLSEEKYRSLFESIDEGFAVIEVFSDERGCVIDLMYCEANEAFERHSGMRDFIGKRVSNVLPKLEQHWLDLLSRVYQTGEPTQMENYIAELGRWLNVHYARIGGAGSPFIAVVFNDVTERKQREQRQEFLLQLSDTLRAETGIEAVGNHAVQMIAERLGADRVYLVTLTPSDDNIIVTHEAKREEMPPLRGSYRGSDFPGAMKEIFQHTIVYSDVRTDARLTELDRVSFAGLGAVGFMAVPIRRGSETMIWAAGAISAQPRSWTATEVGLFEDAVERTWAAVERARAEEALRDSEAWLTGQKEAFQAAMNGESLETSLAILVHTAVKQSSGKGRAAFYLKNQDGAGLHHLTGMPEEYARHVDDFVVSPESLACGLATYRGEPVISADVNDEPRWKPWLWLAHEYKYRACWSFPVRTDRGPILGTLAFYFEEARLPSPRETQLAAVLTHAAAIIVSRQQETDERARAEKALHTSEERLRTLANSMPQLVWSANARGEIDFFNERMNDYAQMSRNAEGIYDWRVIIHLNDRERTQQLWDGTGRIFELEHRLQMKDGTYRWHLVRGVPIVDGEQRPICWYGTSTDIEHLKLLERQRMDFLGVVSHELKTPVTSALAFGEVLEYRFRKAGDDQSASLLQKIGTQMQKLTTLINDLLDVTKIEAGKLQFHEDFFAVDALVDDILEEVQRTTTHVLQRQGTTNATLYGDRERIGQVLTNLLTNAVKYSPKASRVVVTTSSNTQEVKLCVQDFGIGIAKEKLPHVFERFYRETGAREDTFAGLGLGLYVVAQIVSGQGGRVWVESEKGQGSTFCVALPLPSSQDARSSVLLRNEEE